MKRLSEERVIVNSVSFSLIVGTSSKAAISNNLINVCPIIQTESHLHSLGGSLEHRAVVKQTDL